MRKQFISAAELLLTAMIWGVAFVAQSVSMDHIEPFTFSCVRSILGGIVLIPIIFLLKYLFRKSTSGSDSPIPMYGKSRRFYTLVGGIACGSILFVASSFQQFGILYTTVGKAGFITALYIIIVPVLGIFLKHHISLLLWCSSFIAIIGFYFLCMAEKVSISKGDFLVLMGAVFFAFHILTIDFFSPRGNAVVISCIQLFVCGFISGVAMFFTETPTQANIQAAAVPILYAGILSSGVAYTLQIVAQKNIAPTVATIIMSLESVFSVLAGWLLLNQSLNRRELFGCILIFIAVIAAQMPEKKKN